MKNLILLTIFFSMGVFAGFRVIRPDNDLPKMELTNGQMAQIDQFIKKKDPDLETEFLRVEFVCIKNKKKGFFGNNYNCDLKNIN